MSYEFDDLARDLRALLGMSVTTKADLRAWNRLALRVQADIRSSLDVSNQLPHDVWHYFSDADIRWEDPEYARKQCEFVREFLTKLER
jgi:hypothetical protein